MLNSNFLEHKPMVKTMVELILIWVTIFVTTIAVFGKQLWRDLQ
jgi:hypothetical protein